MDITDIFLKSWRYIWRNKALWFFGAFFALTTTSGIYWNSSWTSNDQTNKVPVHIGDETTIWVPGEGFSVEIDERDGFRIVLDNKSDWQFMVDEANLLVAEIGNDLRSVIIFSAIWLSIVIAMSIFLRYIAETALIRMVDESESSGIDPGLREGLRYGWSWRAGKLFLIDLAVFLFFMIFVGVVLALIIGPIMLAIQGTTTSIILASMGVVGLLIAAGLVIAVISIPLSFVMQLVRRVCVVENMGISESFREAIKIIRLHFKDVGLIWVIWVVIRVIWTPLSAIAAILLVPLLVAALIIAVVIGGLPAFAAGVVANAFTGNLAALAIGAIFGLPFFVLVLSAPLVLISGFVEILKSAMWTLGYREIRILNSAARTSRPVDTTPKTEGKLKEAPA